MLKVSEQIMEVLTSYTILALDLFTLGLTITLAVIG